jgi:hypothetical protein
MIGTCLFGWHHFGPPRKNAEGDLLYECVKCLCVKKSPVRIDLDASRQATAEATLARSVAELKATGEWVGIPSNDAAGQVIVARPPRRTRATFPRAA